MRVVGIVSPASGNEQKAVEEIRSRTQQSSESLKQGSERAVDSSKNLNLSLDSLKGYLARRNKRRLQARKQRYDGKYRNLLKKENTDYNPSNKNGLDNDDNSDKLPRSEDD